MHEMTIQGEKLTYLEEQAVLNNTEPHIWMENCTIINPFRYIS